MADVATSAPTAGMSESVTNPSITNIPAAPAETVAPSADESVSPQAEKPAGIEKTEQTGLDEAQEKAAADKLTALKERSAERYRQMKRDRDESRRREAFLISEVQRLSQQKVDPSQITDPDDLLAEKVAARQRSHQIEDHKVQYQQVQNAKAVADQQLWSVIKEEMTAKIPDFEQKVMSVPISQQVADFIYDSDKGGEVAYYLGSHPDVAHELDRLSKTSPRLAERELGRIEARLSAPAAKTVSTAPKPAPILAGGVSPLGFDAAKSGVADVQAALRKAGLIR
ncbi:hypothetical protein [Hyphomicrobium sp. ghe19]|uniref:hypothetical protein n=1 Tax=Hyphomicrobium sp. ghe19 TaxID=2682968 RepID=UPI001366FFD5|nr:hypothetical protein HYPP_01520 [Hyphomicrobium sp. ghe19]